MLILLNGLLSQVCMAAPLPDSPHDRYMKTSVKFAERMKTHGHNATTDTSLTFYKLLDISTFFEYYHAKQYPAALNVSRYRDEFVIKNLLVLSKMPGVILGYSEWGGGLFKKTFVGAPQKVGGGCF